MQTQACLALESTLFTTGTSQQGHQGRPGEVVGFKSQLISTYSPSGLGFPVYKMDIIIFLSIGWNELIIGEHRE